MPVLKEGKGHPMFNYRWSCFKHYQYNSENYGNVRMRLYNNSNLESYRFLGNSREYDRIYDYNRVMNFYIMMGWGN